MTLTILVSSPSAPCALSFLAELNDIDIRTSDIINTYLTTHTTENIVFNSRPDFFPFGNAGHLLLIKTNLYGLKSSGVKLHSRLSDALSALGLVSSMGGCDICMRDEGVYYSYVACYFDDMIVEHK